MPLGKGLALLKPLPVDDPNAVLSGFANPKMGEWINSTLEADLLEPGAFDATAPYRDGTRLLEAEEEPICDRQSYIAIPWITHWQIGISLSLRKCRRSASKRDASGYRTDLGSDCDYQGRNLQATTARSFECRTVESRSHLDHENFLGSATRRKYVRIFYKRRSIGMAA